MAMNTQLLAVVQHIEIERGVSREIVLTAIEQAICMAARRSSFVTNDIRIAIDRKDLSLHVYDTLVVSEEDVGPGFISPARAANYTGWFLSGAAVAGVLALFGSLSQSRSIAGFEIGFASMAAVQIIGIIALIAALFTIRWDWIIE